MRRIVFSLLRIGVCVCFVGKAWAQDLDPFFDLVATGTVAEVAQVLHETPALAVTADSAGFTAVHVLDYADFDRKLALLQRYGADVNARNDLGHGLLHVIIAPEFIAGAVARGAQVDLRDTQGRTPMMVHLLEPDGADFVAAFLAAGADPTARDHAGRGVMDYAADLGNSFAIDLLEKAEAKR